jgi:hypothetical protein
MTQDTTPLSEKRFPTTFTVGAGIGAVKGGGKLTVEPGALTFEPGWATRRLSGLARLVHTECSVIILKARLVPPWFDTSLLLHDHEASAYVVLPRWSRRRLLRSLMAAGFQPSEVSTWLQLSAR